MNYTLCVEAGDWPDEKTLEATIGAAQKALHARLGPDEAADLTQAPVTVLFTNDAGQKKLNAEWRNQDKTTNVLSFPTPYMPMPDGEILPLGDISLAFETVQSEALLEARPFDAHLTHLIVHGFLHLLGYDHEDDEEAEHMEDLEIATLKTLNIANPYE